MTPDFRDLVIECGAAQVECLIVGEQALMKYLGPGFTKEFELFIHDTPSNTERTVRVLRSLGLPLAENLLDSFSETGGNLQIHESSVSVRLTTVLAGITFDEAWATRVEGQFGGLTTYFISAAALLKHKKAIGRPEDREIIERLEAITAATGGFHDESEPD